MMENVSNQELADVEGGFLFLVALGLVAIAGFIAGANMSASECEAR
jgi:lactobin A/cerein 7B family class IIb bacteriocin